MICEGLTKIPYVLTAAIGRDIIHMLNLRRNNIKSVSEHELINRYPGLKMIWLNFDKIRTWIVPK